MEDTIGSFLKERSKGQIFRITYKDRDFIVQLVNQSLEKETVEIDILLDGLVRRIILNEGIWHFFDNNDYELANDIGRAISLRYRLWQ